MRRSLFKRKSLILLLLIGAFCIFLPVMAHASEKEASLTLSRKKAVLYPKVSGRSTFTLKVKKNGAAPGKIKFSSSNRKVARVSSRGVVTGVSAGKAVITVYAGKIKATCTVTCYNASLKILSASDVTLKKGKTHRIKVKTAPGNARVTYRSSAPDIASVNSSGKVTAKAPGNAVITVKSNGITRRVAVTVPGSGPSVQELLWNPQWEFAGHSIIHTGSVKLYKPAVSNGIVVAVNAGHGTQGGESVRTLCHPDGTAKVTGGSTAAGSVYAVSISSGMQFLDGTPEGTANLSLALIVRDKLLSAGFEVLMIRETADNQLDNIARTVFANQYANCHISLHYDSSSYDKGAFCIGVPSVASYIGMYPVSLHYQESNRLGMSLISGLSGAGVKIYGSGNFPMDLTQTSYSKIPSIDLEVGDAASDRSFYTQSVIADGVTAGVKAFFGRP